MIKYLDYIQAFQEVNRMLSQEKQDLIFALWRSFWLLCEEQLYGIEK